MVICLPEKRSFASLDVSEVEVGAGLPLTAGIEDDSASDGGAVVLHPRNAVDRSRVQISNADILFNIDFPPLFDCFILFSCSTA